MARSIAKCRRFRSPSIPWRTETIIEIYGLPRNTRGPFCFIVAEYSENDVEDWPLARPASICNGPDMENRHCREMREIDRTTAERFGVPSLTLMENAGTAVAEFVISRYPAAERIGVICGKGNKRR